MVGLLIPLVAVFFFDFLLSEELSGQGMVPSHTELPVLMNQSQSQVDQKDKGCLRCHKGIESMHASPAVRLGCIDCHEWSSSEVGPAAAGVGKDSAEYEEVKNKAHVLPRYSEGWKGPNGKLTVQPIQSNPTLS